jgi:formylglycine-generating enzyme required for sulfatase activity
VCVSWDDAKTYSSWLTKATGKPYRLLSEAEWEYVARGPKASRQPLASPVEHQQLADHLRSLAAQVSDPAQAARLNKTAAMNELFAGGQAHTRLPPFWWGGTITTDQANYNGEYTYGPRGQKGQYRKATVPVGSFAPNPWGIYQVHGNVWEWVEDVWHMTYDGAPSDGSPWVHSVDEDPRARVVRGGSWEDDPQALRSANRSKFLSDYRTYAILGFRLARTLHP